MENLIPVNSHPVQVAVLKDSLSEDSTHLRFKAVGAIANYKYKSGRLIPADVQQRAIEREKRLGRQMTGFIDHPRHPRGNLADVASIIEEYHFDESDNRTYLDDIRILKNTPKGKQLLGLIDDRVRIGISQRAIGKQSLREWEGEPVYLVEDIVRIFGWDFTPLDDANAGDETEIAPLSDSVIEAIRQAPEIQEDDGESVYETKIKGEASMKVEKPVLTDVVKSVKEMFTTIIDGFRELSGDKEENAIPKEITDSIEAAKASVDEIVQSSDSDEEKINKLKKIADQMQESITEVETAIAEESVPDEEVSDDADSNDSKESKQDGDGAAEEEEDSDTVEDDSGEEEPEGEGSNDEDSDDASPEAEDGEAVTDSDDSGEDDESIQSILDSLSHANDGLKKVLHKRKMKRTLNEKVEALTDASAEEQSAILQRLEDRSFNDEGEISQAIQDAIAFIKAGRATERLNQEGLETGDRQDMNGIHVNVDESIRGVQALADSLVNTGFFLPQNGSAVKIVTPEDPRVSALLKQFDSLYGDELLAESRYLQDAVTTADFQTPRTLSRILLAEVYANYIVPEITDFGVMDNDRDSVPVTKYTRAGSRTFKPTKAQINALKPGELQAMVSGKLTTTFVDIDAEARKLDITLSDEYITRSKRKPNINGVAKALQNMVDDLRRTIQQEVFWAMLEASMVYNSQAFSFSGTGDGNTSEYVVIPSAASSISAADTLTVQVNSVAIKEYGYGYADSLQYSVDYANAKISFVDASGNPSNVPDTQAIEISGKKVTNEVRFSMTPDSGVSWEEHMNKLLFKVTDVAAAMPTNTGYIPTLALMSLINANYIRQAKLYENQSSRAGFTVGGPVKEGNMGLIGGQYSHWASEVFFSDFIIVGSNEATLFRTYEPLHLNGPVESRDSDGRLTGGKEYYAYQEDALKVPIPEKLTLVTLVQ